MKYKVALGSSHYTVTLPESLPTGIPVTVQCGDNPPMSALWHRAFGTLSLIDAHGVEKQVRPRSHQVLRFEGDSDPKVTVEAWLQGVQGVTTVVAYDVPGLENHARRAANGQIIRSQMTGKTLKVLVAAGDLVKPGDPLVIIEAMKMENKIFSPASGKVTSVSVAAGDAVQTGKELLRISF